MNLEIPDEISKALIDKNTDELGLVVRSHLYIESLLNELLSELIPFSEHLDQMHLKYSDKVKLACAMGLDAELKPMLLSLGSLRNKFSHNINTKIDAELVKDLHSKVHHLTRIGTPKMLNSLRPEGPEIESFQGAHPRDQFTSLVISLWVIMHGALNEVKSGHNL